jgi:NaMN:DMB phosphoribosyltransferase
LSIASNTSFLVAGFVVSAAVLIAARAILRNRRAPLPPTVHVSDQWLMEHRVHDISD